MIPNYQSDSGDAEHWRDRRQRRRDCSQIPFPFFTLTCRNPQALNGTEWAVMGRSFELLGRLPALA